MPSKKRPESSTTTKIQKPRQRARQPSPPPVAPDPRPASPFSSLLERLLESLAIGDFRPAIATVVALTVDMGFVAMFGSLPLESPLKCQWAGAIYEVLAYLGRNGEATWLGPWFAIDRFIPFPESLAPRIQLQVAEHLYWRRQFDRALELAQAIRDRCRRDGLRWGEGEAELFLARCFVRKHDPAKVYDAADAAVRCLSDALPETGGLEARRWRIASALLVGGFAGVRAGHLSAIAKLQAARGLLSAPDRDYLACAHADHSLGAALRSLPGRQTVDESLAYLDRAAAVYAAEPRHHVHLARALTNLGRTYLDYGHWAAARERLDAALQEIRQIHDVPTQKRQEAETRVFLSWLHQSGEPRDLEMARSQAEEALRAAAESREHARTKESSAGPSQDRADTMTIEGWLALGSALASAGPDFKRATEYLETARTAASKQNIRKLVAHAYLCLADRYCRPESVDLRRASEHLRLAETTLGHTSSLFLSSKLKDIRRRVDDMGDLWFVTRADLLEAKKVNKFKEYRERLEEWIIDRVENEHLLYPTLEKRGKVVGVSAPGYLKKKQQVDRRRKARS
jgi:tetratricopeptide (TPR) repeat protein